MNMAITYGAGLEDRAKEEEMYRLALDGYERSLGKSHKATKVCVKNLAILLCWHLESKEKTRELVKEYPILLEDGGRLDKRSQDHVREFIK